MRGGVCVGPIRPVCLTIALGYPDINEPARRATEPRWSDYHDVFGRSRPRLHQRKLISCSSQEPSPKQAARSGDRNGSSGSITRWPTPRLMPEARDTQFLPCAHQLRTPSWFATRSSTDSRRAWRTQRPFGSCLSTISLNTSDQWLRGSHVYGHGRTGSSPGTRGSDRPSSRAIGRRIDRVFRARGDRRQQPAWASLSSGTVLLSATGGGTEVISAAGR